MIMNELVRLLADLVEYVAVSAYGNASNWGAYQPQEPNLIIKSSDKANKDD